MNKYQKAIETLKNEYDAFYFENKYGECTHQKEFDLLAELEGDLVPNALRWIRECYDCYYKELLEINEDNAFDYLGHLAERKEE